MAEFEEGEEVVVIGRLKKVVDFLATADKETIRILASFFQGDAKGTTDAKKLSKTLKISKVYLKSLEVVMQKGFVWEEKQDYFNTKEYEDSQKN